MEEFTELTKDRGLYKKILEEGKGSIPNPNAKVILDYKLNMEDGTSIYEQTNKKIDLSDPNHIQGIKIGVCTMKKGEKSIFVMRYDYAYGETSYKNIKPFSTIIACIDLKEIL
jgi:FKBP-type peptidyl-prolyl cis-trans isomerase